VNEDTNPFYTLVRILTSAFRIILQSPLLIVNWNLSNEWKRKQATGPTHTGHSKLRLHFIRSYSIVFNLLCVQFICIPHASPSCARAWSWHSISQLQVMGCCIVACDICTCPTIQAYVRLTDDGRTQCFVGTKWPVFQSCPRSTVPPPPLHTGIRYLTLSDVRGVTVKIEVLERGIFWTEGCIPGHQVLAGHVYVTRKCCGNKRQFREVLPCITSS
jgi:hypothetical protein